MPDTVLAIRATTCSRPQHVVAVQDERAAPLDNGVRVAGNPFRGPDTPAHPIPHFQDDHVVAGLRYPVRGQQASEPGPHHNPHGCSRL